MTVTSPLPARLSSLRLASVFSGDMDGGFRSSLISQGPGVQQVTHAFGNFFIGIEASLTPSLSLISVSVLSPSPMDSDSLNSGIYSHCPFHLSSFPWIPVATC